MGKGVWVLGLGVFIFRFQFLFLLFCTVGCSPPEDPIKCSSPSQTSNCTISNSYGAFPDRSVCRAADVVYPTSEEELVAVVANGTMRKRKMKVATLSSHSIPKLMCPHGEDGLLISTKYLNRTLKLEPTTMTITVETGVTLRQLIDDAAKAGLALPYSPYWWGFTVGGLLATGAHGSSLWGKGSAVHDYVVELRIVTPSGPNDNYAKLRVIDTTNPDELSATRVSLGVLGVISQVTLRLEPLFKRSITYLVLEKDTDLGDQAIEFGNRHEFADITWYPSQRKVAYRIDDRVNSTVSGNGRYDFLGFRAMPSLELATIRSTEESQEYTRNAEGKCVNAKLTTSTLIASAYGLTNDGIRFTGYPVVGYNNRLEASGTCLESPEDGLTTVCPWDPRVKSEFFHQTAVSVALSKVKSFIQDVQKLRDLEPKSLCGLDLYNGILMRYVKKTSNAYLGKQEDAVDFDISYYRSSDPMRPRLYEDIMEEIEQLALVKYEGLPHWGKNRNIAFNGAINKYGRNAEAFLKVKQRYDPQGLFSSEWTDKVLGIQNTNGVTSILKEGCALEGLCVCSQDNHCAPHQGFFCRPGKVYQDARVCTSMSTRSLTTTNN
ncbi:probable L-gulonolactone oxidase 6 [Telopea speciosissima]|uniref:probable L-gulonolactone oxidase 6 n=1 Tax=Telopea speciosissima TaxID=54955 RepID=UPI001CC6299B|nr:probable L-gulonolactone oxidase 6 [Telopea speciosissima]